MTEAAEFTVEVRGRDFVRLGQIAPEYMDIKFVDVHNGVGSWEMKLPAEHPLLAAATAKGAGIVITEHWVEGVTHKYRVFSGRMRSARLSQDATDPLGTWIISGVDDNVIAAATTVYPDPANLAGAQTAAYWEQNGTAETVMKLAVQVNAGSTAIASRKYPWLSIATNLLRGSKVRCSSRFDSLGDLLTSLGTTGGLGWEFRQLASGLVFDVYVPANKTGEVRLDIINGGLDSNELGFTAPSATDVLVMGQGEGADRTILKVNSSAATAEAVAWGLRWEVTKDQRNTDVPAELTQAGEEILTDAGSTVNSLKVSPSDAPGMALGRDWYRGDRITVVVDGQETTAIVTQVAVSISSAGVLRQATVGDPVGFDFDAKVASKVKDQEKRIGAVERLVGQGVAWGDIGGLPSAFPSTWPLISGGDHGRGTTAQRDAQFGVPATAPQIAALANRKVTWFNTNLGWEESYYAVTGTAGLTAIALVTGAASGWYPTGGELPYVNLAARAPQTLAAAAVFVNWGNPGTGYSTRGGGAAAIAVASGVSRPKIAGRFRCTVMLPVQPGSGSGTLGLGHYLSGGVLGHLDDSHTVTLNATLPTQFQLSAVHNLLVDESMRVYAYSISGAQFAPSASTTTEMFYGHYTLEYLGPPLVSN